MIQVTDLSFTYPGKHVPAVKGVSFQVSRGEIFGFLGPSGAGKSTIQKIIIGILKGYQGSVLVGQQEINKITSDYYEKIGVSFELPNLYSRFTAYENLAFFRSLYSGKTADPKQLLEAVGLAEHANEKVASFSKGMKMRLNFCRAMLNDADLIFLDEPTSGLDPVNTKLVKDLIWQKKNEGKTILITTHNMGIASEICDRVAFIVDGQIKLIDAPRDLIIRYGEKRVRMEYKEQNEHWIKEFDMEGLGLNDEFLMLLKTKEIERLHTQDATLEDIFIKVTGWNLV